MIAVQQPAQGTPLVSFSGLFAAFRGWHRIYVFVVAMNVVAVCAAAAGTAIGAWAVSWAILGAGPDDLRMAAILVAIAVVVRGVCSWLESWLGHDISFRMMSRVRAWIFAAIARIAPAGISRRRAGDVATTAMTDAEALEIFYAHSSVYALSAAISTPILWTGIALLNLPAALVVLPVLFLGALAPLAMRRIARDHGTRIRLSVAQLGAEVNENVGAVREIVGYGMVRERMRRIHALDDELASVQLANARRAGLESAAGGVVSVLAALAAAVVGSAQAVSGALDPPLLTPLIVLSGASPAAIIQWIGVTRHYGTTGRAAARIEELLYAPSPVDRQGTAELAPGDTAGVHVERVSFAWPGTPTARDADHPAAHAALSDIATSIAPGESVAFAGRSGAGKSTFAALLARFMDPDSGEISIDRTNIRRLSESAMSDAVCLVPQEVYLFHTSIRDNLLLAVEHDRSVDDAALWHALDVAHAADLVRQLPGGLDTVVGERGTTLSGGERQRLALARSVLHRSRVLILDETVSQLDVSSEREVRDSLAAVRGERTTVVIAHRLSTLLSTKRILVLDQGRIVGDGWHDYLIETCPTYRALVAPQVVTITAPPS